MALLMNAADMDRMLEEIRPEGETYTGKAWGTIMGGAVEILALGALSNVYCYVGVTERSWRPLTSPISTGKSVCPLTRSGS